MLSRVVSACDFAAAESSTADVVAKNAADAKAETSEAKPLPNPSRPTKKAEKPNRQSAESGAPRQKAAEPEPAKEAKPASPSRRSQPRLAKANRRPNVKAPEPKRNKVRLAQFVIKSSLPESLGGGGPFGEMQLDLRETISRIDKAADDRTISGAVLDIQNPSIGRGKIYELRAAIQRFRAKGKKMYAQVESAMPADYLVACRLRRDRDAGEPA